MPKESRPAPGAIHRTLPYPTVSSSGNMAPYTTTASSTHRIVSPPPSGGERHASASWPKEKDEQLIWARQKGLNWQPIAHKYFPDKSANACRKRHERLMEKRNNADEWDPAKTDALAKAYNDLREQTWRPIADRIGEKWQVVESKCMEKGLKTLQTAGRTLARRDRVAERSTLHPNGHASELEDYPDIRHRSVSREFSKSRPNSDDGFNDSAIGPDPDHPFVTRGHEDVNQRSLRASPQSTHQAPPFSQAYPTPSRGHTPPFPPPTRKFSNASSSAMSSTDYAATISATTQFPSQLYQFPSQLANASARERQNSTGSGQTLPSFSDAFGMPSISGVSRMPLTSMS